MDSTATTAAAATGKPSSANPIIGDENNDSNKRTTRTRRITRSATKRGATTSQDGDQPSSSPTTASPLPEEASAQDNSKKPNDGKEEKSENDGDDKSKKKGNKRKKKENTATAAASLAKKKDGNDDDDGNEETSKDAASGIETEECYVIHECLKLYHDDDEEEENTKKQNGSQERYRLRKSSKGGSYSSFDVVDRAIDSYEEETGVALCIVKSRIEKSYRLYGCHEHVNCPFRVGFGPRRADHRIIVKTIVPFHSTVEADRPLTKDGRKRKRHRKGRMLGKQKQDEEKKGDEKEEEETKEVELQPGQFQCKVIHECVQEHADREDGGLSSFDVVDKVVKSYEDKTGIALGVSKSRANEYRSYECKGHIDCPYRITFGLKRRGKRRQSEQEAGVLCIKNVKDIHDGNQLRPSHAKGGRKWKRRRIASEEEEKKRQKQQEEDSGLLQCTVIHECLQLHQDEHQKGAYPSWDVVNKVVESYETKTGFKLDVLTRTNPSPNSRLYGCKEHVDCPFRIAFGPRLSDGWLAAKTVIPIHSTVTTATVDTEQNTATTAATDGNGQSQAATTNNTRKSTKAALKKQKTAALAKALVEKHPDGARLECRYPTEKEIQDYTAAGAVKCTVFEDCAMAYQNSNDDGSFESFVVVNRLIESYEQQSGTVLGISKSRANVYRQYTCKGHLDCPFKVTIGPSRRDCRLCVKRIIPYHSTIPRPERAKGGRLWKTRRVSTATTPSRRDIHRKKQSKKLAAARQKEAAAMANPELMDETLRRHLSFIQESKTVAEQEQQELGLNNQEEGHLIYPFQCSFINKCIDHFQDKATGGFRSFNEVGKVAEAYERITGFNLGIRKSRANVYRLYWCRRHIACPFRVAFGRRRRDGVICAKKIIAYHGGKNRAGKAVDGRNFRQRRSYIFGDDDDSDDDEYDGDDDNNTNGDNQAENSDEDDENEGTGYDDDDENDDDENGLQGHYNFQGQGNRNPGNHNVPNDMSNHHFDENNGGVLHLVAGNDNCEQSMSIMVDSD